MTQDCETLRAPPYNDGGARNIEQHAVDAVLCAAMMPDDHKTSAFLSFDGLESKFRLNGSQSLLPTLDQVVIDWPYQISASAGHADVPLAISATDDGQFVCKSTQPDTIPKHWDGVNAVCELIVELAWAQIRANRSWLCLHCAAVAFAGRLVLFPNARRAGKSTLAAVLAQRGHNVFTDDFLPVMTGQDAAYHGRANGILPRIRLPVPQSLPASFLSWVKANKGPENAQYKYLETDALAPRGEMLPIGAVVLLDRDDSDNSDAALQTASVGDAVDGLISQNFAREIHASRILNAAVGVAETAELFQLRYSSASDAADLLESVFDQGWSQPIRPAKPVTVPHEAEADLGFLDRVRPQFDAAGIYAQAPGASTTEVADITYIIDGAGVGIHRLNPGSVAIWDLLQSPISAAEIVQIYRDAFPDIPGEKIKADIGSVLENFLSNGLMVPIAKSGDGDL